MKAAVEKTNTTSSNLGRRAFLSAATAAAVSAASCAAPGSARGKKYRVAIIGHTGRGDYGHGHDVTWRDLPETEVVAVADADEAGLAAAVKRLGSAKGFADYRKMLDEVKPDVVAVAPRYLDEHSEMVVAAAGAGVKGIYLEKPMCRTLAEADQMEAACQKNNVKLAIAFQTRYSQKLPVIEKLIADDGIGRVIEFRIRGKEDRLRGGGEDLWVLGPHMFNLADHFGGKPQWCFGSVYEAGHPVTKADVKQGNEGIGPLAGDDVHAMFRLAGGASCYFDSTRDAAGSPSRFGIEIFGTKGVIQIFNTGHLPQCYYLRDSSWAPGMSQKKWVPITSAGVDKPEPLKDGGLHEGNVRAVADLLAAIEEDRQPLAGIEAARTSLEMVLAIFESQRLGKAVTFPLETRENPLAAL